MIRNIHVMMMVRILTLVMIMLILMVSMALIIIMIRMMIMVVCRGSCWTRPKPVRPPVAGMSCGCSSTLASKGCV